ncbi:hypothetical protein OsJ_09329 [Oryza sativa Japonica Group]|uniref:Uncharacterized protein n=1 Tax=Oryza sativa subsp. japonica TaxID=39947 RepID=B9FAZ1_ORYSJ|nr:hypothetical protein OsJ_09329 [Oryza sativa Japonica Group]
MGPTAPPPDAGGGNPEPWAASCVLLFLLVKLRFDHRRIPGPSALAAKLLAVYHATAPQIALHCGADAAQFLLFERASFLVLAAVAAAAVAAALPLNLLAGDAAIADQFAATTISHIPKSSPLLWLHLLLTAAVVAIAHLGISRMEDALRITRFRDGNGNPSDPNSSSVAVFTIMIQGIPKTLAADKTPLKDYFEHKYPGKVYRVIVPFDLCTLEYLAEEWGKVRNRISWLEARMDARNLFDEFAQGGRHSEEHWIVRRCKELWVMTAERFGFTDEEMLRRLQTKKLVLGSRLSDYKDGRAPGAGIAFVVFKDVYTANKAVRDFRMERKKTPIGRFFPVMELQLERSRWTVERAPPASDIYWNHLGLSKTSLGLRRIAVNTCLILMLLFFSSPLAIISGMQSAARIINVEAMDNAKSWLVWLQSSSWFWTIIFQFLPNVLIFVSMYIIIPSVLSYFSKFECHLTVSGEQRAALLKMVCFFLVNLILLRALVESSLESWILSMGRCYLDSVDCKQIEQYLSPSFLSRSSLSSLAFLITCTFLGISFDLLAPIPWIKHVMKKFRKNDMVQLVPEENEDYQLMHDGEETNNLRAPLMSEREDSGILNGIEEHDLSLYPINRSFHMPKQTFDFAQYYAFDITIFALTMIYSLFAPLTVPVGAVYFGYRYLVDKYNFLFIYRVRGFPAGNDGKLMDMVRGRITSLGKDEQRPSSVPQHWEESKRQAVSMSRKTGLTATGVKIDELFIGDIQTQHKSGKTTVDVKIDSESRVSTTVTVDEALTGLKTSFSFRVPDQKSGKLDLQYLHDHFALNSTIGLTSTPLIELAATIGTNELSAGAEVGFDSTSASVTKYNSGICYNKHDFSAAVLLADKGETLKASYIHTFNETNGATVAAEVTHKLKTKENYFTIGSSHAIDSSTLLKTRFSNGGKVGVLCQHEWRPKSTVSISAEYDPKVVSSPSRFGVAIALKP